MTIYINKDALKFIYNEVQISKDIETGGILVGVVLATNDILITHAVGPGPNAIKRYNEFQKDYEYSMKMLNFLYKKYSVDFIGDWHKHPNNNLGYSIKDYTSMIKITYVNKRPCFFIIVGDDFSYENRDHMKIYSVEKLNKIREHSFLITDKPESIAKEKGILL